ncbi:2-oxoglutarate (2OG) and Fe(II)-dependent oxygenase superfamily protein [Rhynchospora pubera]|uniref:2-oxoglutarate (2OG) and Fe(II)-dependent oxygenase superfamily protein n=1 Tax=Rhynchospora pubera TaxID=906938 RepID=A0AAV8E477_9POAL|nr:2-oxoglutarate (2OG) and Fe(II)-dependent oxygenase superfamily protein [Rhynchospora pubera]KAJ4777700.1 2-oxoglutarate (2OG) and Fe(II)-dependent oxygenase superfamily protein [Rhynchospora pubera]
MSPPNLYLPLIDLSSTDRASIAQSIRKACMDHGFFYVINHGIDDFVVNSLFRESKNFFDLPLSEKMKLERNTDRRGYSPPYAETLDPSSKLKGDLKETFDIGPINDSLNQWPSKERMPAWRVTMESYDEKIMNVGFRLISLIALALNLDENFFTKIGALDSPVGFLRLLHYLGEIPESKKGSYGASAHSDYVMITLLVTDGVPGLQICREKDRSPQLWEDVHHVEGALIINIGDMMERWTNCTFRSIVHRVVAVGQERYSAAFFLNPNYDCVVECLESCCSETSPPRFPPIKSGDYLEERLRVAYSR